jgi:hypothetical protein
MSGFEADLPAIDTAATALRGATDSLTVTVSPPGDVGPGRLGAVVAELLTTAESDLAAARATTAELAETVTRVRNTYAELDTDAASRFDLGP